MSCLKTILSGHINHLLAFSNILRSTTANGLSLKISFQTLYSHTNLTFIFLPFISQENNFSFVSADSCGGMRTFLYVDHLNCKHFLALLSFNLDTAWCQRLGFLFIWAVLQSNCRKSVVSLSVLLPVTVCTKSVVVRGHHYCNSGGGGGLILQQGHPHPLVPFSRWHRLAGLFTMVQNVLVQLPVKNYFLKPFKTTSSNAKYKASPTL